MAKISIEQIEATLLERKIDAVKVHEIIKDLEQVVEEEKADRLAETDPKPKWEHLIILDDPEKKFASLGTDFVGWVVQQKEGTDAGLVLSKLVDAAKTQNEGGRKKKLLIKGFTDLFDALKPKSLKEKGIRIKTKHPVRILTVDGKTLL